MFRSQDTEIADRAAAAAAAVGSASHTAEESSSANEESCDSFGSARNSSPGPNSVDAVTVAHSAMYNPRQSSTPTPSSIVKADERFFGRLSPMVTGVGGAVTSSRLQRLQLLQARNQGRCSAKMSQRLASQGDDGSTRYARDSTSSLESTSLTPASSTTRSPVPHLWDVRATKTPIKDLRIMTHNAKHTPVFRSGSGGGNGSATSPTRLANHHSHQASTASSSSASSSSATFSDPWPRYEEVGRTRFAVPTRCQTASSFDRLPDNVILNVLSFLNSNDLVRCSRISRRFYFLAWEPELWTSISLTDNALDDPPGQRVAAAVNADLALKTVIRLLSRNSNKHNNLESLVLNGCHRLTDRGLAIVARRCPNLTRLEIQQCSNVTNGGLMDLLTKCPLVNHLDVSGCSMISTVSVHQPQPNPAAARASIPSQPSRRLLNLQFLDLTDCSSLEDSGLKRIVENCPHLLYLFLRRCSSISDAGIKHVAAYCLGLREMSVSDCTHITDLGLIELAKLGPNLRYLSVAKCDLISDDGIKQIARLCYKLRYLNMRGCESISDDALETVSRSCTRLRSLDIGKCDVTDAGLKTLSENCPNLKKLSAKSCEMITDQGIQFVAYYCRGLQQLNIQDSPVTIDGYRTVKRYCKRCIIEHSHPGFF